MFYCDYCGKCFTKQNNIGWHPKENCNYTNSNQYVVEKLRDYYALEISTFNEDEVNSVSDHNRCSIENVYNNSIRRRGIPTFDVGEFCCKKLKSRETIYKIMQLVGVPQVYQV